jgi:hypothetical protein
MNNKNLAKLSKSIKLLEALEVGIYDECFLADNFCSTPLVNQRSEVAALVTQLKDLYKRGVLC